MHPLIVIVAIFLAAMRISGHKSEIFQAGAHLFVGGLLTAWWLKGQQDHWHSPDMDDGKLEMRVAIALSVVEVACALWFKFGVPA